MARREGEFCPGCGAAFMEACRDDCSAMAARRLEQETAARMSEPDGQVPALVEEREGGVSITQIGALCPRCRLQVPHHFDDCPENPDRPAPPKPEEPHPTGRLLSLERATSGFIAREGQQGGVGFSDIGSWAFSTLGEALEFAKRYLEG